MNKAAVVLGVIVNFIWGLAFLFPYLLKNTSPVLITSGRYMVYGLIALILLLAGNQHWRRMDRRSWGVAAFLAFSGNIGYYISLTMAVHFCGITITALIIGILPLSIMLMGNWESREVPFGLLIFPAILILAGLTGINWLQYETILAPYSWRFWFGVFMAFTALALWTWYGIVNAAWLKRHTEISPQLWSLSIGVWCLAMSFFLVPWLLTTGKLSSSTTSDPLWHVMSACLVLGALVSWMANICCNKVSRQLPVTLSGQIIVFETIASLIYGHIVDQRWPNALEFMFIFLIILGVVMGINIFQRVIPKYAQ